MNILLPWMLRAWFLAALVSTSSLVHAQAKEVILLMPAPPNLPGFAPWIIAQEKGYYEQFGITVKMTAGKGGADVAKQVGAGNAMFGVASGDIPIIVRANGVPVKSVAMIGEHAHTLLAVDPAQNIRSIEQLKNKTVSVMSYSDSMYYTLLASLRQAGLSKSDVNIQAAGPAGVWQLFADGKSDAMAGTADWVVNIQDTGRELVLLPREQLFDAMPQGVIASENAIADHPELVQAIVSGTLMGLRDILQDPAAAARVFTKAIPSYAGKEDKVERTMAMYIEHVYGKQTRLGKIELDRVIKSRDFYLSEGIIHDVEPVDNYYTNKFVEAATTQGLAKH